MNQKLIISHLYDIIAIFLEVLINMLKLSYNHLVHFCSFIFFKILLWLFHFKFSIFAFYHYIVSSKNVMIMRNRNNRLNFTPEYKCKIVIANLRSIIACCKLICCCIYGRDSGGEVILFQWVEKLRECLAWKIEKENSIIQRRNYVASGSNSVDVRIIYRP